MPSGRTSTGCGPGRSTHSRPQPRNPPKNRRSTHDRGHANQSPPHDHGESPDRAGLPSVHGGLRHVVATSPPATKRPPSSSSSTRASTATGRAGRRCTTVSPRRAGGEPSSSGSPRRPSVDRGRPLVNYVVLYDSAEEVA